MMLWTSSMCTIIETNTFMNFHLNLSFPFSLFIDNC